MFLAVPHPPAVTHLNPRCVNLVYTCSLGATQRQGQFSWVSPHPHRWQVVGKGGA